MSYACNGATGQEGAAGKDGLSVQGGGGCSTGGFGLGWLALPALRFLLVRRRRAGGLAK